MEIAPCQAAVNHFNSTDFDNPVPFIMDAEFIHTGGFSIENDDPVRGVL
ncbi:hypothetical protein SRABI106_00996 [Rahnella aquatilis]|nr:hypothetical protein SRABI106_00996 [Rahnella aquatilis]